MIVIERRLVYKEWYEDSTEKDGWSCSYWLFEGGVIVFDPEWNIEIIKTDKFGHPTVGIATREVTIN